MAATSILLVEDNQADRLLVEEALLAAGHTGGFEQADTIAAALQLLDERESRPWPGLVIVDSHLPDGSGAELIARVRERPGAGTTLMVMLSGDYQRPAGLVGAEWYEKPDSWKGWLAWGEAMLRHGAPPIGP